MTFEDWWEDVGIYSFAWNSKLDYASIWKAAYDSGFDDGFIKKGRAKKDSFEAVFGHLGTPEEVAAEWMAMKDALKALNTPTSHEQHTTNGDVA